jgi:hypothetical protein
VATAPPPAARIFKSLRRDRFLAMPPPLCGVRSRLPPTVRMVPRPIHRCSLPRSQDLDGGRSCRWRRSSTVRLPVPRPRHGGIESTGRAQTNETSTSEPASFRCSRTSCRMPSSSRRGAEP